MRKHTILAATALAAVTVAGGTSAAVATPGPGGASAVAKVANSPGVLSGNAVQVPVNVGLNVCGNTIDVIGLLNPAAGNKCKNK
ncbi:chaplin [Streptomyces sp. NPDC017941]|uniref:chaplin n=1 Tax=Streptomyces sp. NPDC017941 TaxID=3365018 RepID=UPI00378CD0CF